MMVVKQARAGIPADVALRSKRSRIRRRVVAIQPLPNRMALSVNETAWELNCSPNTVWSLIGNGDLPSFKVGRRRLVSRSALQEFIEQGGTGEEEL
jgi:excisionase family DNA binding protein